MTQALDVLLGERIRAEFTTQEELVEQLVAVAAVVKATRDAHRQTMLVHELQRVKERMVGDFRLPLSPSLLVRGVDVEVQCGCELFFSNYWCADFSFSPVHSSIPIPSL